MSAIIYCNNRRRNIAHKIVMRPEFVELIEEGRRLRAESRALREQSEARRLQYAKDREAPPSLEIGSSTEMA